MISKRAVRNGVSTGENAWENSLMPHGAGQILGIPPLSLTPLPGARLSVGMTEEGFSEEPQEPWAR